MSTSLYHVLGARTYCLCSQLKELELHLKDVNHPSIVALKGLLQEFRDDELEHLDTGTLADHNLFMLLILAISCRE